METDDTVPLTDDSGDDQESLLHGSIDRESLSNESDDSRDRRDDPLDERDDLRNARNDSVDGRDDLCNAGNDPTDEGNDPQGDEESSSERDERGDLREFFSNLAIGFDIFFEKINITKPNKWYYYLLNINNNR